MSETVVLDPSEVADGRVELDITPFVAKEGIDWGDGAIESYMAEAERGSLPVDFRIPNRQIQIPLALLDRAYLEDENTNNFDAIRSAVQAKAALFQREGGWVKRSVAGDPVYAEVVSASLKLGGGTAQATESVDVDAVLTLEAIPDFFGDEVELLDSPAEASEPGEIVFLLEDIEGHHAARARILVEENGGNAQRGLIWSLRSRHYHDDGLKAVTALAAQDLTALDTAAAATVGGQPVVRHQDLSVAWTPVLSTDVDGAGPLTHTGTNRVWASVYSTSLVPPRVRLVWDVADMVLPVENTSVSIPGHDNFWLVDLGEVHLDPPPVGVHRWRGQIQAQGAAGGENVSIRRVFVLNADEGYGILRAPLAGGVGLAEYVARDEFNQAVTGGSDPLTGLTPDVGDPWAVVASSDSDDFVVEDTGHTAQRTAVSDAVPRMETIGAIEFAAVAGQVNLKASVITTGLQGGILLRSGDVDDYVMAGTVAGVENTVGVVVSVAGDAEAYTVPYVLSPDTWYTARLAINADGQWAFWFFPRGSGAGVALLQGHRPELAGSGALEEGKVGLYDGYFSATASTRSYKNLVVWEPESDAVLHPDRSVELRSDGMFREVAAGDAWGPVSHVVGDLPRLPPSGLEGRPCEVFLLATGGDLDQMPETAAGDLSAEAFYRPSYLTAPPGPPFPSELTIPSEDLIP